LKKEIINAAKAGALPYSPAVRAGDFIFVSGQVGHLHENGTEVAGIEAQTMQCLHKLKVVLEQAGASLGDVVKATVFLGNQADFAAMNEVYKGYFPTDPPARSTLVVGFPIPKMLVEIECIAYKPVK
jgi:2-iminobutanoate/2-iminopropanoate deaminase